MYTVTAFPPPHFPAEGSNVIDSCRHCRYKMLQGGEMTATADTMKDGLTLGICQLRQGYDLQANVERALELVAEAADRGADMACLPEMFLSPYEPVSIRRAAPLSEATLHRLQGMAKDRGIFVVAGSMPWPSGQRRIFNRSYVINQRGETVHYHDKIHLFDCNPPGGPRVVESDTIAPGGGLGIFPTPWGNAAVIVCYDIRFTPLTQLLADRGVRLLVVPAAFSLATGKAHWEMLVRMRAVELQGFVAGVQPAHNPELGYVPWGHSLVASPWGDILSDAGTDETVEIVRLDLAVAASIRERFPLRAHRRDDLYETIWKG